MPRSRKPGPAVSRPATGPQHAPPIRTKSFAALAAHVAAADRAAVRKAAANLTRSRSLRNR